MPKKNDSNKSNKNAPNHKHIFKEDRANTNPVPLKSQKKNPGTKK